MSSGTVTSSGTVRASSLTLRQTTSPLGHGEKHTHERAGDREKAEADGIAAAATQKVERDVKHQRQPRQDEDGESRLRNA